MLRSIIHYRCQFCHTEHRCFKGIPKQCAGCRKTIVYRGGRVFVDIIEEWTPNKLKAPRGKRPPPLPPEVMTDSEPTHDSPSVWDLIRG